MIAVVKTGSDASSIVTADIRFILLQTKGGVMVTGAKIAQTVCPYCVLGLVLGASENEVKEAYERLTKTFNEERLLNTPQAWVQAQQAFMHIEDAYKRIMEGEPATVSASCQPAPESENIHPKLGQMLVAAGLVTLEQLDEAIAKQRVVDLRIGEVLKGMNLVTQMELDSFLLNQRLITLPLGSPYHFGRRLIGLGVVTEDMVRIALVEQRTSRKSLGTVLCERNWLSKDILAALIESGAQDAPAESEQVAS